jgi:hypothetical protein
MISESRLLRPAAVLLLILCAAAVFPDNPDETGILRRDRIGISPDAWKSTFRGMPEQLKKDRETVAEFISVMAGLESQSALLLPAVFIVCAAAAAAGFVKISRKTGQHDTDD